MRIADIEVTIEALRTWLPEVAWVVGRPGGDLAVAADSAILAAASAASVVAIAIERPEGGFGIVVARVSDFARIGRWDLDDNVHGVHVRGDDVYVCTGSQGNYETSGQLHRLRAGQPAEALLGERCWSVLECHAAPLHLHVLLGARYENDDRAYVFSIPWASRWPVDVATLEPTIVPLGLVHDARRPGGALDHLCALADMHAFAATR
jgi:hypothetical protein